MADQEVIKHAKKAISIWGEKEHSFWHKLKEFVVEIGVIVFAVSLSIWFHGLSEHKHQQKEVKEFLVGLHEDFNADIKEMEADKKSYFQQAQAFETLGNRKKNSALPKDTLEQYYRLMFNPTWYVPNNGRFEGFKSAGKIGLIEDYALQNEIMDLYQENIPSLLNATNSYRDTKKLLWDFILKNRKVLSDSTTNMGQLLQQDEPQNVFFILSDVTQIERRYDRCIEMMQKINGKIEKEYGITPQPAK